MVKKKSKPKKRGKTYQLELSSLSTFIWGVFLFFLLTWVFVLGILVGRGFLPEAVTTISDVKDQITKLQGMVNNKGSHELSSKKKSKPDPELVFYDRLSSKKDEVKQKWRPKGVKRDIQRGPTNNKKTGSQSASSGIRRTETSDKIEQPALSNDKIQFTVQIASLENGDQAERMTKRLNKRGYSAYFYEVTIKGKVYYRVRCGRFNSRDEAKRYAEKLVKEGIKGFVSRLE